MPISQAEDVFATNFFLFIFGSAIVTLNARLIGCKYSLFFCMSLLGYANFPMLLGSIANLFLGRLITR